MLQFWFALLGLLFAGFPGAVLGFLLGYLLSNKRGSAGAKAWGGILGFMFAGPLGAIAGVYLGSSISSLRQSGQSIDSRSVFQINLLSILAQVVKADGEIQPEEIQTIMNVFIRMGYPPYQLEVIQRTLAFALKQEINLPQTCENFKKVSKYEERLMLLRVVYMVVMADGVIHANEKRVVEEIVNYLEIEERDYISLQAEFGQTQDKYYQILGLKRGATKMEVKRAYRKLSLTHHPDRVAHLGEEYARTAKEKFQTINEAYAKIMDELKS